jgi:hypothetical protein
MMPGTRMSEPCTEELAVIVAWVAGLGAATAEALARRQGLSVPSARARLSLAERRGLLAAWRPLRDQPALYTATRAGLKAAAVQGIDPARVSPGGARHGVLCSLVAAELHWLYPGQRVIGEAEHRREERLSGGRLASAAAIGPAQGSHRPDLALLGRASGYPAIAVEVELTVKSPRRLAAICLAWARARHVAGVLYLAGEAVRPALGRAIEESRSAGRIAVVELETLESADGATGAIERAIAGGA